MHIGLIGGIGPAATVFYYRRLTQQAAARGVALDLTLVHADVSTLLGNLAAGDAAAQAAIFRPLAQRLAAAGAEAVAVTAIAGHFCIEDFKVVSPLPVIDLLSSVPNRLREVGYRTVGILGTKTVMQSGMYGCLSGLKVLQPGGVSLDAVHQSYADMATAGAVTAAQRKVFFEAGRDLCAEGAEAVLLGGTDFFLAFDGQDPGFKAVDCAELHLADIIEQAAR